MNKNKPTRQCKYCSKAVINIDGQVICKRKGPVLSDGSCFRYSYDPFKRIPIAAGKTADLPGSSSLQDFT